MVNIWLIYGYLMFISRQGADVANVTCMALLHAPAEAMRFDLCAKEATRIWRSKTHQNTGAYHGDTERGNPARHTIPI